jgi:hypothetical protein
MQTKKPRNVAATEKINQQSTHSGPKFSAAVMLSNNTFNLLSDVVIYLFFIIAIG